MKKNKNATNYGQVPSPFLVVMIFCGMLGSGCRSFSVTSNPEGAKILINGRDTKVTTPQVYNPGGFVTGDYTFTVEKDGYLMVSPPQVLKIRTSGTEILLSVFIPPVFVKNLFGNHWKRAWPRIETFQLQKGAVQSSLSSLEQVPLVKTEGDSINVRLIKLNQLRDQDLISEDEYNQKRKAVLDEL